MRLPIAFISYFIAVVISLVLPILGLVFYRKKEGKLKVLHIIIGMLSFLAVTICYFLVLKFHLSASDGVADYYNTATYRVVIIAGMTLLLFVILWVLCMLTYMKRQLYIDCRSFFVGFGSVGCIAVGLYSFVMLLGLSIQCLCYDCLSFDEAVQAFCFSDGSYFVVFTPLTGHISFAIAVLSFLIIVIIVSAVMKRIVATRIPMWVSVFSFLAMIVLFIAFIVLVCFMNMFKIPHYLMAIIVAVIVALMLLLRGVVYRSSVKEVDYRKQFE